MFLDAPDATVALSREVVGMGSKARGFTLIELMVIVVLLAILAFMAIPSFKAMQEGNNHLAGRGKRFFKSIWSLRELTQCPVSQLSKFVPKAVAGLTGM
nr:prepilin-type N-terminal cleavage/methylation domain-containing protein [Pseudomonas aeruginosa]